MRILQVCPRVPFPARDGGTIAIAALTEGLHGQGCELDIFALNTTKDPIAVEELDVPWTLHTAPLDNRLRPVDALVSLVRGGSYNLERFDNPAVHAALATVLQSSDYDAVLLEGLSVAPYISTVRRHSRAKVVLRAHNVEHRIWESLAATARGPRGWYLSTLARRLKHREIALLGECDAVLPITPDDAAVFAALGCRAPMHVTPLGIDVGADLPEPEVEADWPTVFHLGAMDWAPNQQGVLWFVDQVWPLILQRLPGAKLFLAGRKTPEAWLAWNKPGVTVVGQVPDAAEFMISKGVMIVPLSAGSGMRIKIIEGMALAKPIVSTTLGAEGISCRSGEHLLLADTPEDFAQAVLQCLDDRPASTAMGQRARQLVAERYSNESICYDLASFLRSLCMPASDTPRLPRSRSRDSNTALVASVVIPCRNENGSIQKVLADISRQTALGMFEVLVADGMSDDGTREELDRLARSGELPFPLRILSNPARHIPHALNRLADAARGEHVIRIDGHTRVEPRFVEQMVSALSQPDVHLAGPRVRIVPGKPTLVAHSIAAALNSRVGNGGTPSRNGLSEVRETEHTVMSCYRRYVWDTVGGYDERLLSNEDFDFDYRATRAGYRVVSLPDPQLDLAGRATLSTLARQRWRYGFWKAQVLRKQPRSLKIRQLLPAALPLAVLVGFAFPWLLAALGSAYLLTALLTASGARELKAFSIRRRIAAVPCILASLLVIHFVWAAGLWYGFTLGRVRFEHVHTDPIVSAHELAVPADVRNASHDTVIAGNQPAI